MNCLVVGATGGIGRSVVRSFAREGHSVYAVVRDLNKANQVFENECDSIKYMSCDVKDEAQVGAVFSKLEADDIKLDAMIYCAGVSTTETIRFLDENDLINTMDINAFGFVRFLKHFSTKKISLNGSSVVVISSLSADDCTVGTCAYSMSKAALNAAVITAAKEMMRRQIRVNAILPAYVDTDMIKSRRRMNQSVMDDLEKQQPLGVIDPDRIADLVYFLTSSKGEYITGELIRVSGGRNKK